MLTNENTNKPSVRVFLKTTDKLLKVNGQARMKLTREQNKNNLSMVIRY